MMIARQNINEARRMIANQHLASSMAKTMLSGSAGRAKLELLSIYSNMKANELVAPQTPQIQDIINNSQHKQGLIDAKAPLEGIRFGKNQIRFCSECRAYITKTQPCKHVELAPEEAMSMWSTRYDDSIEIL
jgi:hypothetical protein